MRLLPNIRVLNMKESNDFKSSTQHIRMMKEAGSKGDRGEASQGTQGSAGNLAAPEQDAVFWLWADTYEKGFDDSETEAEELFFSVGAAEEADEAEEAGSGKADLEDASRRLTKWLVASKTQFEVQLILGEAHQHIGKLRMVALSGDEEAIKAANAIIRKLEKLVRRGNRKLTDLGNEDVLRRKQAKAEKDEQIQRAKQIEAELRRKLAERKKREEEYLNDKDDDDEDSPFDMLVNSIKSNPFAKLDAASEAKIKAQAQAQAAMEVSSGASSGAGNVASTSGMPGAPASDFAGEGAAVAAGAEGEDTGGIDIAV